MEDKFASRKHEYKLIIVGDKGVGVTSFINRIHESDRKTKYTHKEMHVLVDFQTSKGNIMFNIWDSSIFSNLYSPRDSFYNQSDCAIIMFDVCSRVSYKNVRLWYKDITRICPDIPIILVGNKIDNISNRKIKPNRITFHRQNCLKYIEISAMANYNYEEVYLTLMKLLEKEEELYIIKGPRLNDAIINVDEYILRCFQKELEALEKEDLGNYDDDF